MDLEYRQLQRLADEGDPEAKAKLLLYRVRIGELTYDYLFALALFGDPTSTKVVGHPGRSLVSLARISDLQFGLELKSRWIKAILENVLMTTTAWNPTRVLGAACRLLNNGPITEQELIAAISQCDAPGCFLTTQAMSPDESIAFLNMMSFEITPPRLDFPTRNLTYLCNSLFLYLLARRAHPLPFWFEEITHLESNFVIYTTLEHQIDDQLFNQALENILQAFRDAEIDLFRPGIRVPVLDWLQSKIMA